MKNEPLVSVLIFCYNQEQYIADCLESVINQTHKNIEILIGDDCSTDNTRAIIEVYQKQHPEIIKPVYHPRNVGIPKNVNSILSKVTGEYVAILGGDDIYLPDKLETQIRYMAQHSDCIGCYARHEAFDSSSKKVLYVSRKPKRSLPGGYEFLRLSSAYRVDMLTILFKSSYSEPFNENIPLANDTLFIESLNARGKLGYINQILYKYRRHNKSITYAERHNYKLHLNEIIQVYEVFYKRFNPPEEYFKMALSREYCYAAASAILFDNNVQLAAEYLQISKNYFRGGLLQSLTYLLRYNAPALSLQYLLSIANTLRINFIISFFYKIYVQLNPKFQRQNVKQ